MLMLEQGIEKRILAALGCLESTQRGDLSRTRLLAVDTLHGALERREFCQTHILPEEDVYEWLVNYLRGNRRIIDQGIVCSYCK